jgi:DNA polymerase-3 subunit gamma/tau
MIEASEAEAAALKEQSAGLRADALTRMLEVLTDCEGRLRDTASKKILVEVALLKMIEARDAVSIDAVLKQIQQLRSAPVAKEEGRSKKEEARPAVRAPIAVPSAPLTSSHSAAVNPPATAPTGTVDLAQLWAGLCEGVGRASPFVNTYFKEAHPVSFVKNVLTIGFDPEFADHLPMVDNSKNHSLVQTKLAEMGYPHSQVRFIKADAPPRANPVVPAPSPPPLPAPEAAKPAPPSEAPKPAREQASIKKEDFKNDPLIQKALEVFKGQIVEVRS